MTMQVAPPINQLPDAASPVCQQKEIEQNRALVCLCPINPFCLAAPVPITYHFTAPGEYKVGRKGKMDSLHSKVMICDS